LPNERFAIAIFNLGDADAMQVSLAQPVLGIAANRSVRDAWSGASLGRADEVSPLRVNPHGARLVILD
jgi:hypothetical protein